MTRLASEAGASVPNILACAVIHRGFEALLPRGVKFAASRLRSRKRCAAIQNTQGGSRAMMLFEVLTTQAT
ncbi:MULTISPECIES: hypothetical protein [Mesorhizobium]|uniref:hypothetical protein n=1 Tax=Mesorhizobium TaxID=68287 RepID=UPI00115FBDEC|nr:MULTISPECIES: hypothetical protein [Mesorhizobium]MCH4560537.1 hypothetical protein [Mesorhizobium jarvisii]QGU21161.1 hypothetical protein MCHK_12045 [Mesorhizobium huakuii 7653R]